MRNVILLFLMPFFMMLLSAGLGASSDLEKWASANLFDKIETTMATAKTGTPGAYTLFESNSSGERAITEETLQTFSVTEWGNFTYDEKMRFIQTAFSAFELTGTAVLDNPETFISLMDARYKEFLTNEAGLNEHTDLSEISLFTEIQSAGQQQGRLVLADDH